jgi:branched-subunit amino acid ABC-type transport system permease component
MALNFLPETHDTEVIIIVIIARMKMGVFFIILILNLILLPLSLFHKKGKQEAG